MKTAVRRIVSVGILLILLFAMQRLVMPKYVDDVIEGGFTAEYYREENPHEVLMVGDCELYENFSPVTMWKNYGITSYIRGSAQQLTWQSYYLLEDALKYETPDVVVFNVLELKYNEPQREEYNRMTLDGMRWSVRYRQSVHPCCQRNILLIMFFHCCVITAGLQNLPQMTGNIISKTKRGQLPVII